LRYRPFAPLTEFPPWTLAPHLAGLFLPIIPAIRGVFSCQLWVPSCGTIGADGLIDSEKRSQSRQITRNAF
jgi:hypothetical protein